MKQRLAQLKSEHEEGQKMLAGLEEQASSLRETLMRIAGAIQVMEEMVAESAAS